MKALIIMIMKVLIILSYFLSNLVSPLVSHPRTGFNNCWTAVISCFNSCLTAILNFDPLVQFWKFKRLNGLELNILINYQTFICSTQFLTDLLNDWLTNLILSLSYRPLILFLNKTISFSSDKWFLCINVNYINFELTYSFCVLFNIVNKL